MKLCRVLPLLTALMLAGCSYGIVSDQALINAENAGRLPGFAGIYAPAEEEGEDRIAVEIAAEEPPQYRWRSAEEESGGENDGEDDSFTFLLTPLGRDTYLFQFNFDQKSAADLRDVLPANQAADRYYRYEIVRVIDEQSLGVLDLTAESQATLEIMTTSRLDRVIASWGRSESPAFLFFHGDRQAALEMFVELSRLETPINAIEKLSGGPLSRSSE